MQCRRIALLLSFSLIVACGGGGSGGDASPPPDSLVALELFDAVWADYDATYSFFVLKGIDWSALRTQYRSQLNAQSVEADAHDVISAMLLELRDGHVRLTTPFGTSTYTGWFDPFPENFDESIVAATYLGASRGLSPQANLTYGHVTPEIGYVRVASLIGSGFSADLEFIVGQLVGIEALVIDVRSNGGGNDVNGEAFVARLATQASLYRRVRFRDGPNHTDFGPFIDSVITPVTPTVFTGPIAVLTNRRTASSAESMVLALRTLPDVVTVGDFTGGISANPVERVAANGWRYTISRWIEYLPDNSTFEGIGLEPDIRVDITAADAAVQRDTILDAAIAELSLRIP
jgi:hypothetical protein